MSSHMWLEVLAWFLQQVHKGLHRAGGPPTLTHILSTPLPKLEDLDSRFLSQNRLYQYVLRIGYV